MLLIGVLLRHADERLPEAKGEKLLIQGTAIVLSSRCAGNCATGHDGAAPGYLSVAYESPDGTRAVVALINAMTFEETPGDGTGRLDVVVGEL